MFSALVVALVVAAPQLDTVFTADGGRIAGTVLEESPTAGVTLQLPDGTVRRIERSQVSRIEFADGSVSTPTPPPAAAPVPVPAPKQAPAEGPLDSVYFVAGGRARGTVMEEAATGVKVRLLDGSIRAYPVEEIERIQYADGTVSTPRKAPARTPEPAAAPAPAPRAKPEPVDNVYFAGGGRVRGTVIEEHPKTGVKVRLLDGTVQVYAREELVRIEYADGSVSRRVATPAPAVAPPAPVAPPQPAAAPPPAPPPRAQEKAQAFPIYLSLGLGVSFLGGDAEQGRPIGDAIATEQGHVSGEIGLRFTPSFALGVYGDVGGGDVGKTPPPECQLAGADCSSVTGHFGVLARHTWNPLSRRPVWLSLGTGWEFGGVTDASGSGHRDADVFGYTGREYLRLGAGMDFRTNDVIAIGLYGSVSFGEYKEYENFQAIPSTRISVEPATHTTTQIGVRFTLFP